MNEHVALKPPSARYEDDVYAWAHDQARLLAERRLDLVDLPNLIEEIESLGNELAHSVESHLIVLVEHLLKLAVSADQDPRRGWRLTVINQRSRIERRLRKSPSLRRELPDFLADNWKTIRLQAAGSLKESEERLVPKSVPFTLAQILDEDFFPGD